MNICGTEIDFPFVEDFSKGDKSEYKEGSRTRVREVWVYGWERDSYGGIARQRYRITMTNRGATTFDFKPVFDEKEKVKIKEIFESVWKEDGTISP